MADGMQRGAVGELESDRAMLRGRGTRRNLKPGWNVSPGTDTQIVDQTQHDAQSTTVRDGGGGTGSLTKPVEVVSPAADTIAAIVHLQRQRTFCIRTQSRTDRSTEAFIARECLGYHTGLPPAERKALMAQAARIRLAGEKPLKQTARGGRSATEPHGAYAPGNGRDRLPGEAQISFVPPRSAIPPGGAGWTLEQISPVDALGPDAQDAGGDRPEFGAQIVHVPGGRRDRRKFAAQSTVVPLALPEPDAQDAGGDRPEFGAHVVHVPGGRRDRVRCETRPLAVPPLASPEPDAQDGDGDQDGFEAHAHAVPTSGRRDRVEPESLVAGIPPLALPIIQMSYLARTAADGLRRQTEREMERLAATLPVASWQAAVKGFGRLGLAIVVAEAGRDLACYGTVAKLWKRLGLAVIDGERQRRKTDAALAALHGYAPHRRAEMWTLADSMFRHQWKSGGEDGEGSPAGPYGAVYARRRARTAETHPEWTKAHARDDARRVMFKALVADLWGAWRAGAPS
jgi:hypothetical protein